VTNLSLADSANRCLTRLTIDEFRPVLPFTAETAREIARTTRSLPMELSIAVAGKSLQGSRGDYGAKSGLHRNLIYVCSFCGCGHMVSPKSLSMT
jgi:hypothetical protein